MLKVLTPPRHEVRILVRERQGSSSLGRGDHDLQECSVTTAVTRIVTLGRFPYAKGSMARAPRAGRGAGRDRVGGRWE